MLVAAARFEQQKARAKFSLSRAATTHPALPAPTTM